MNSSRQLLIKSVLVFSMLSGCSSPASQSSAESVRDPLGVERAVNDYYFPDGLPAANENSDHDSMHTDTDDVVGSTFLDEIP